MNNPTPTTNEPEDKLINLMTGYAANANGLTLDDAAQVADLIKALSQENKELNKINEAFNEDYLRVRAKYQAADKENAALRTALEIYADEDNWAYTYDDGAEDWTEDRFTPARNGYDIAKAALANLKPKTTEGSKDE